MSNEFRLLLISAMYENGGNITQRLLDGHPELFVYPFESELGTRFVSDYLSSLFPVKYRWPRFDLSGTPLNDYEAIIDEECKVRIKTPQASKFRGTPIDLDDADRKRIFICLMQGQPRIRGRIVEAFFRATFEAWKDWRRQGSEKLYVGYSPIIVVDAGKILVDLPEAHILHVVRNPWSAYADTKKRPVPLSMEHYMTGWTVCQYFALLYHEEKPEQVHILKYEDIVSDPEATLSQFCLKVGLYPSPTLGKPSWNGEPLSTVYPWGMIYTPTVESNRAAAAELGAAERKEIALRAGPYLKLLGYDNFLDTV